jgi:hypothetical protein
LEEKSWFCEEKPQSGFRICMYIATCNRNTDPGRYENRQARKR